jgi:prepilin-type N-terminal cleavage/methylation domain-containing protein/prepilin-type processing-associated H-X9-DG protein
MAVADKRVWIMRGAFTLVELLVVVAVIALLVAILLPSMAAARERAQRVKCMTNLRSLAAADLQYANDYNGYIKRNSGQTEGPTTFYLIAQNQRIPLISATWPGGSGGFESQYAVAFSKIKWMNCPSFPKSPWAIGYIANGFDPATSREVPYLKVASLPRPSEVCNFTEANTNLPVDNFEVYDIWDPGHLAINLSTPVTAGSTVGRCCSDDRHRGLVNLSYYDGHVDNKKYKKSNGTTNLTMYEFVGHY